MDNLRPATGFVLRTSSLYIGASQNTLPLVEHTHATVVKKRGFAPKLTTQNTCSSPHNSTLLSGVDQVPLISASAQQMTATVAAASVRISYWNSQQVACTAHHYNIPKLATLLRRAKHSQKGKVTATCLTPVEKSE